MNIVEQSTDIINIVKKSSTVFIMGHRDLDLDAISSCIAFDFYAKYLNKKSYIIIDDKKNEVGVKKVLDSCSKNIKFIRSKEIEKYKKENSLLVILDTSKPILLQNPYTLSEFENILNIDHHDKTKESLKATLSVIDDEASSACEMISLFLKENEIKINSSLATLLLSGIILDTNYFRLKADADTFYMAYYLSKCGGKVTDVNELLKQNLKDYIKRQKIISSVKVIKNIAIGRGRQRSEYKKEELAKTADSLLTFDKIKASFVIAKIDKDLIGISGRSYGEINIGKILERFGGGGNEYEGAARIGNSNVNKIIDELSKIIRSL